MKAELRIFVYGTLKKGLSNHEAYCGGVSRIVPAKVRGRLFKLTPQIPIMMVPGDEIIAAGSADLFSDLKLLSVPDEELKRDNPLPYHTNIATEANIRRRSKLLCNARPTLHGRGRLNGKANQDGCEWRDVEGEVLFFDDPETRLPLIDGLEEFRPGKDSTYLRVLVKATPLDGPAIPAITVWTYIAGFDVSGLDEYEGGNWVPDEVV